MRTKTNQKAHRKGKRKFWQPLKKVGLTIETHFEKQSFLNNHHKKLGYNNIFFIISFRNKKNIINITLTR